MPCEDKRLRHVRGCFHHGRPALVWCLALCVCLCWLWTCGSQHCWAPRWTVGAHRTGWFQMTITGRLGTIMCHFQITSGLQGCHNNIWIIVPVSHYAPLKGRHQSTGRKPAMGGQKRLSTTFYVHVLNIGIAWSSVSRSGIEDVPTDGCLVLSDVIEHVQGKQ